MELGPVRISSLPQVLTRDESVEQVDSFHYLGSLITADGRCEKEIEGELEWQRTRLRKWASFSEIGSYL